MNEYSLAKVQYKYIFRNLQVFEHFFFKKG